MSNRWRSSEQSPAIHLPILNGSRIISPSRGSTSNTPRKSHRLGASLWPGKSPCYPTKHPPKCFQHASMNSRTAACIKPLAGPRLPSVFGTHLRAYLQLFRALPRFEFIYIAPIARFFQAAESQFHHVLCGRRALSTSVNVLDYFRLRKAWDAKERVASADVVLLKEAQQRYVGSTIENEEAHTLLQRGAAFPVTRIADHCTESRKATFRTLVCQAGMAEKRLAQSKVVKMVLKPAKAAV